MQDVAEDPRQGVCQLTKDSDLKSTESKLQADATTGEVNDTTFLVSQNKQSTHKDRMDTLDF